MISRCNGLVDWVLILNCLKISLRRVDKFKSLILVEIACKNPSALIYNYKTSK
jgi:hypothetical protein